MVCDWGSWAHECDIPHWLGLIIEAGIGGTIALFFYWIQKRKSKKRERFVLKRLSGSIIFLEYHNKKLGEIVKDHYDKNRPAEDFFEQLDFMQSFCKEVRADVTLFSQDIDEKLIDKLYQLLSSIESPLPYMKDKWRDDSSVAYHIQLIEEIRKIIDTYSPSYMKDAQLRRENGIMDLAIANKNLRELLGENTDGYPQQHVDNKGSYWWE